MAIRYVIEAEVVDITSDTPKAGEAFLVDTNVWFWVAYPTASQTADHYQLTSYPEYVNTALGNGSRLSWTGLSLAELSHRIEKIEHEIYQSSVKPIHLKEYRHNLPKERSRVVSEIQAAWETVKSLAVPLALTVDEPTTDAALARCQTQKVNGYDLFLLETMKAHRLVQVITDDGDFATVPGIRVFTANRNVTNSARLKGRLITR